MSRLFHLPLLTFGALIANAACLAASVEGDAPAATLEYTSRDLARPDGPERLYNRIRAAAALICTAGVDDRDLARVEFVRRCTAEATARAVAQVDSPRLSAYVLAATHGRIVP